MDQFWLRRLLITVAFVVLGFVPSVSGESPVELLSLGPEKAVDRDADGQLDYLEVPAKVSVAEPGRYLFSFRLRGGSGTQPDITITSEVDLGTGEQVVTRQFTAPDLHQGRHRGRYEISVKMTKDSPEWLVERQFVTLDEYDWQQFADRVTYCFDENGKMITDWLTCLRRRWE